jgi:hypothetical protein
VQQHSAFAQKLDDARICFKDVLAAEMLYVEEEISGVVDGTIDL